MLDNPSEPQPPAPLGGAALDRTAAKVQQLTTSQLQSQKGKLAEVLQSSGSAIRRAGQGLREEGQQGLSQYADQGAQKVEEMGRYVGETDAEQLLEKARETARRQPLLVMGVGFGLAFLVARFLKATPAQPSSPPPGEPAQPSEAGVPEALPEPQPDVPVEPTPTQPRGRRRTTTPTE